MDPQVKQFCLSALDNILKYHLKGYPYGKKEVDCLISIIEKENDFEWTCMMREEIHRSPYNVFYKYFNGSVVVESTNPKRPKINESSICKFSNDQVGWEYFNNLIKPLFPKGTRFRYRYRCPNDDKPYPRSGGLCKGRGKTVTVYFR